MIAEKRRAKIIELVNLQGSVSIEELLELFDVSRMTIWRDLKELEVKGEIIRAHGGALKIDEFSEKEEEFDRRRKENLNEKRLIAKFAAKNYVKNSDIIFLDGGSTILEMIPHLKQENLTVLSNGLYTLLLASKFLPHLNVIGCGGILRKTSFTFVGHEAEEFFSRYKVDTAFISGTGVTLEDGIMDPHPLEMEVKRIMCKNAKTVVALIDSSKFEKRSLSTCVKIDEIDFFITDNKVSKKTIDAIRERNVEIIVLE
ncbi:MAG: DeoR/GlpR family DNA-binding transcription regulator [Candidatus Hermodarchaeota archaeon]